MRRPLILAALLLAACGTKGPLTFPPKPQPVPAAKTSPAPVDHSSKPGAGAAQ